MEGLPKLGKFLAPRNTNETCGGPSQGISFQIPKGPSAPEYQIAAGAAGS